MRIRLITSYSRISVRFVYQLPDGGGSRFLDITYSKCLVDRSKKPVIRECINNTHLRTSGQKEYSKSYYGLIPQQEYYFSVFATSEVGGFNSPKKGIYFTAPKLCKYTFKITSHNIKGGQKCPRCIHL